MRQVTAAR